MGKTNNKKKIDPKTITAMAKITPDVADMVTGAVVGGKLAGLPGAVIGGAPGAVKTAKKVVKIIKDNRGQHPAWYTQDLPEGSRGIITANFSRRKGIVELGQKYFIGKGLTRNQSLCLASKINLYNLNGEDSTHGWKQGINKLYTSVRRANTTKTDAKPTDYEKYVLTVRACYVGYYSILRAYQTTLKYSAFDSTEPYSLFAAMGVDADTFRANSADIYNSLIQWRSQLENNLLLNIPLLRRTRWLYSNIFQDSDSPKCSYFCFAADDTLYWDEENKAWSVIDFSGDVNDTVTGLTWDTMRANMQKVVDAFSTNSLFQDIASDILRAFASDSLFDMDMPEPNQVIKPLYDAYALTQVQNVVAFSEGFTFQFEIQTYSDGFVNPQPKWLCDSINYTSDAGGAIANCLQQIFMNSPKDAITDGEVLSYSRLMIYPVIDAGPSGNQLRINVDEHGTEIVKSMYAFVISPNLDNGDVNTNYNQLLPVAQGVIITGDGTPDYTEFASLFRKTACWGQLDWSPRMLVIEYLNQKTDSTIAANLWDFDTFAKISREDLDTYHSWANLSLVHVPMLTREPKTQVVKK